MTALSPGMARVMRITSLAACLLLSSCRATTQPAITSRQATPTDEVSILIFTPSPTIEDNFILVPTPTIPRSERTLASITPTPEPTPRPPYPTEFPQVTPTATSRFYSTRSMTDPLDRVVFASNEMGNLEIFAASLGPGGAVQLTTDPAEDTHPALSPDGRMVAFASDRNGNFDLFLMELENGSLRQLTYHTADDTQPAWSPDGSQIVFVSKRDGNNELYIIDAACALKENGCPDDLYRMTRSVYDDLVPDWSPDGKRIAFMTGRDGDLEIYHAKADGTDIVRLTNNPGADGFPTWSPDSTMVAFHSEREGNIDIYARAVEGPEEWRLTFAEGEDLAPDWHGDHILYMGSVRGKFQIFLIQAPGITPRENRQQVWSANRATFVGYPSWSRLGGTDQAQQVFQALPTPRALAIETLPLKFSIERPEFIEEIAWHPDGSLLIAGGPLALYFFDIPSMELVDRVELDLYMAVNALDFSPDGSFLATGHHDHRIRIWDPSTKQVLAVLEGHAEEVDLIEYAPDGGTLASAGRQGDLFLWDLQHGIPQISLYREQYYSTHAVEFSPDGRLVTFGAGPIHLNIFDRQQNKFLEPLQSEYFYREGSIAAIAINPIGSLIASGADKYTGPDSGHIQIYELPSGERLIELPIHNEKVVGLEFTPDGERLVGMTEDGYVYCWDTGTWELMVETFVRGFGRIHEVVLDPGGRWLSVATYHGIHFFDLEKLLERGK